MQKRILLFTGKQAYFCKLKLIVHIRPAQAAGRRAGRRPARARPPQRVSKPRKSGPTDAPRSRPRKSLPFRCIRDGAACKNPPTCARHKRNKSDGELRTNKARWRAGRFLRTRAVSRRNTPRNVRHPSPFGRRTDGGRPARAPPTRHPPIAQGRLVEAQTPVLAAGLPSVSFLTCFRSFLSFFAPETSSTNLNSQLQGQKTKKLAAQTLKNTHQAPSCGHKSKLLTKNARFSSPNAKKKRLRQTSRGPGSPNPTRKDSCGL